MLITYPLRRNDYQNNLVNMFSCNCPGAITGFSCRAPENNSPKAFSCMSSCPARAPPCNSPPEALTGFSCRAPENNSKIIFPACNHFESEGNVQFVLSLSLPLSPRAHSLYESTSVRRAVHIFHPSLFSCFPSCSLLSLSLSLSLSVSVSGTLSLSIMYYRSLVFSPLSHSLSLRSLSLSLSLSLSFCLSPIYLSISPLSLYFPSLSLSLSLSCLLSCSLPLPLSVCCIFTVLSSG